jgi:hypothetical protein
MRRGQRARRAPDLARRQRDINADYGVDDDSLALAHWMPRLGDERFKITVCGESEHFDIDRIVDNASLGRIFWEAVKMGGRQLLTMAFCALVLMAAFIALPTSAKAYSWWSGWDSYAECMDYYAKNPPNTDCYAHGADGQCYRAYTAEERCASKKAEEDEKRREQAKMMRTLVLSCRAASVSDAQFAACVALATGR